MEFRLCYLCKACFISLWNYYLFRLLLSLLDDGRFIFLFMDPCERT
jgi:hypothetical protein